MAVILIVEDNASIAKIWSLKLQKDGHEVAWAKTGKESLDMAGDRKPALILMDIMIPGIDGIEVFQQLRQNVETSAIPVLFLSSSARSDAEIKKLLDLGAEGFIAKFDVSPGDLAEKVREILERRGLS